MSELAGQKKMKEFLGKEKPSSEEQKGDKATPKAMSKAKQEDFMLMLNDKIDRILERLGDVDTRTKSMEEKLACVSDRLSTVESKMSTVEEKAENAIEQATAVRVENGSLEVRLKKIEHEMQKSQDVIDDLQGRLRRNTLIFKGFPEDAEGKNGNWGDVEHMVVQFCVDKLGLDEDKIKIERAHRTPTSRHQSYELKRPRPIYAAFLSWKSAADVLGQIKKTKDLSFKFQGKEHLIFVEQFYSPNVAAKRKRALKKRWQLKQDHPDWKIWMKYPDRLFYREGDKDPVEIY